jgi:hypothetical protein
VHLQRDVEPLSAGRVEEPAHRLRRRCRLVGSGDPDAVRGRHHQHPVDRAGPVPEQPLVPGGADQHQFGGRVAGPQRVQGRQYEDEIAERVGPEYGDPLDVVDQVAHLADHRTGTGPVSR